MPVINGAPPSVLSERIDLRGLRYRKLGSNPQESKITIPKEYDFSVHPEFIDRLDRHAREELQRLGFDKTALDAAYKQMRHPSFINDDKFLRRSFFEFCQKDRVTVKYIGQQLFLVVKAFSKTVVIDREGKISRLPQIEAKVICEKEGEREYRILACVNEYENAPRQAGQDVIKELDQHARRSMDCFSKEAFDEAYQVSNRICGFDAVSTDPRAFFQLCQEGRVRVKEAPSGSWILLIDAEKNRYEITQKGELVEKEKKRAICITAAKDDLQAFGYDFQDRKKYLESAGLSVDLVQQRMSTVFETEAHISNHYPDGCSYLLLRMHGLPTRGILSDQEGGQFDVNPTGKEEQAIQRICQTVAPGGVLVIESCQAGNGEDNLLKFLANHCQPGVVVIGSKANIGGKSVEVGSLHPKDIRFYSREKGKEVDATRIYYQSARGPVEISVSELDAMMNLLGREELDLCCQFLGEKDNPETFAAIREQCKEKVYNIQDLRPFKETLRRLRITQSDLGEEWQEMLTELASHANLPDPQSLAIYSKFRQGDLTNDEGKLRGAMISDPDNGKKAFMSLLGMGSLDKFLDLLSLADLEEHATGDGIAAQSIHALSGLAVHVNPNLPLTQTLESYLALMKESYRAAKKAGRTREWADKLLAVNQPCMDSYVQAMNEFLTSGILSASKQERIRAFIQTEDAAGLRQFLKSTKLSNDERAIAIIDATGVGNWDALVPLLYTGNISDEKWDEALELAERLEYPYIVNELNVFREFWKRQRVIESHFEQ